MDVSATSAANLYSFQSTAKSSGQTAAVLQALGSVVTQSQGSGSDGMSNALTMATTAPVVNAMYSMATNTGTKVDLAATLQGYTSYGGLDSGAASALLSGAGSGANSGLDSALTASSTLALTAYSANQKYGTGIGAATGASANQTTTTPAGSTGGNADVTQVLAAAQASSFSTTLSLLG
jgi:hypothetical protein